VKTIRRERVPEVARFLDQFAFGLRRDSSRPGVDDRSGFPKDITAVMRQSLNP
jgi:hypothetical protein